MDLQSPRLSSGSRIFNGVYPYPVTHQATEEFIHTMNEERQCGRGFVPLVGAGFSAPSGVPLVWEIRTYLSRCICMAMGAEDPKMRPWNPRTDQWPPFIDRDRPDPPETWRRLVEAKIQDLQSDDEWNAQLPIFHEALGAMAEWRTALLFLSRLVRDRRGLGTARRDFLALDAPRQEIIDACFREVLRDKHPTLGHRMLAALAGALRLDLLITTNFDDLLERAFDRARNPLEVFDLHVPSNLPHWSTVSTVRSLIKLHGGRFSVRADYSLDGLPSEPDTQRFTEYLLSHQGRHDAATKPFQRHLDFSNHLLVMGCSINDRRTRALIEHAWDHLDHRFRVFWVCHSEADVTRVVEFTEDYSARLAKYDKAHAEFHGSCILRHTNVGLFLLQLYQMIRKNLPPLGSVFPSVSRLAAPPLVDSPGGSSEPTHSRKRSFHVELSEALQRFEKPDFNQPRLVVASTPEGIGGLTTACAHVFRRCESDHVCLWLDMNDISSTDNLFDVLLETAYYRLGLENWTPVSIADESQSRAGEIQRLVNSVSANWIVFLNARETPGLNLEISVDPHGWLDQPSASGDGDPSATADAFLELLHELCGPGKVTEEEKRQRRISVVLLCRNSANRAPLLNHLEACGLLGCHISLDDQSEEHIQFSPEEIVKNAIQWAEREPPRRRFLHALVLMQRPRFLATIWSSALLREPDRHAHDVSQWVRDLEVLKLVRRKEGGFIWLHARCREKLRKALRSGTHQTPESLQDGYTLESWTPQTDQAEIHNELARWYNKVLDASDAPPSAFEVVYHLCLAAASAMKHNPELSDAWIDEKVEAAAALLKTHAFLIQTHGYSRGSCRRLEYIRDTLCDRLDSMSKHRPNASFARNIGRLRKVCTEVMRAIAREVGEDVKAYHRQQELAFLYLSPTGPEFVGSWKHDLREWRNDVNKPVDRRSLTSDLLTRSWPQFSSDGEEVGAAMRWLRWSAMLAIGTRSYGVAGRALRRANDLVSLDSEGNVTSKDRQPLKGGSQQNLRMELLRIAEQQVALLLLEDSLERRLGGAPAEGRVTEIRNAVAGAMEIARHIRQRDHSSDSHNTTRAIWAESRLLMHQSICAARQINIAQEPTSYKAQQTVNPMGLLGDAEANLRLSDARRDRWELALVDLHRAEARLQEATAAPIRCTGGTTIPFGVLCRRLEEERPFRSRARERGLPRPDPGNIKERKVFRESYVPGDEEGKMKLFDDLRRARSLVGDAIRFLGRAEPELRERRRNVWWTTWFFERKLQAIALSIWASSFEKDTPIPFLGLEAAMRKTVTVADVLFEDASRMIRVDSYRLAAVLDSYASCAKALQIRQMLDPEGDRLFLRQERMQNELTKGIERLSAVHANRMNPQRFMSNKSGEVDARVNRYVELVIARCKRRAEELQETC